MPKELLLNDPESEWDEYDYGFEPEKSIQNGDDYEEFGYLEDIIIKHTLLRAAELGGIRCLS